MSERETSIVGQYHPRNDGAKISGATAFQGFAAGSGARYFPAPGNGRIGHVLLDSLIGGKWLIALAAIGALLASLLYTGSNQPFYEADMLLQTADQGSAGAAPDSAAELLRSRLIVSRALEQAGQYTSAEPRRLPLLRAWLGRDGTRLPVPPGLGTFAWGAESIELGNFSLPAAFLDKEFWLTSEAGGRFSLHDGRGLVAGTGQVGVPMRLASTLGPVELLVTRMDAMPGIQFRLLQQSASAAVREVQAGLHLHRSTTYPGLVKVVLQGNDKARISAVLAAIGDAFMAETHAAGQQRSDPGRRYINARLVEARKDLQEAESRHDSFLATKGTADLGEEFKFLLQQLAAAKARKAEFVQRREDLLARFTPNHPALLGQEAQMRTLNADIASLASQIKAMPAVQQGALRLAREVERHAALVRSLENSAGEVELAAHAAPDPVRVVDTPLVSDAPAMGSRKDIVGLSVLAGLLLGYTASLAKRVLRSGVSDPEDIEQASKLPVHATIPHSRLQRKLQVRDATGNAGPPLLARDAPLDESVEMLRRFRAALLYSTPMAKNNIVLFASPGAQTGKSFIAVNLAVLLGAGGTRVLLIDGDLRQGVLHRYFQAGPGTGLSDALAVPGSTAGIVQCQVAPNVDFISCGGIAQGADLLQRPGLQALLSDLAPRYDLVLVDGAPVLEVSDALTIGKHAGAIYIVTRANRSTLREIDETVRILEHSGLHAAAFMLNALAPGRQRPAQKHHYGRAWPVHYVLAKPMKAGMALSSRGRNQG